ncbi:MAG: hypothetical protein ACKVUS_13555 [Saprospiraceae bacterium]
MENQVNKLRILKLKDPTEYFKGGFSSVGAAAGSIVGAATGALTTLFEVQVNPEQIRRDFKVSYHYSRERNSPKSTLQIDRPQPEALDLKFTLDGTGALQQTSFVTLDPGSLALGAIGADAQGAYVATKVAQLQATVYDYMSETHAPPLLAINWGKLVFIGKLVDMSVSYNLFAPSGIPLRAEITLKVQSHSVGDTASAVLSFLSPDLTRRRVVRGSDNLLTLCQEVYESEKYYLEVAKANGLTNFRKIDAGVELDFPPIEKRRVV